MKPPAALFLDLDDTLVRDDEAVVAALFATCAGADCPTEELFLAVWHQAHSLWERPGTVGERCRALGVRPIEALMTEDVDGKMAFAGPLGEYREGVWTAAAVAVGWSQPPAAEQLASRLRDESFARWSLLPGAFEALAGLPDDVPLALVTNGPADLQREKVRRLGLEPLFEAIVISAEEGFAKPDPRIYQCALERLNVEPSAALMVGDHPVEDVEGALSVGLAAVLLRGSEDGGERLVGGPAIDSIAELPSLFSPGRP